MQRTMMVGLAVIALAAGAIAKDTDAPADEYFGPFKYSALSVRTKITSLGRSYRERWADDASIVHDAGLLESSLTAWAQKYPKDVWLAPTAFHLAQLYQEVQTQDARNRARAMYQYVAKAFPKSKEAHFARLRLQQGFPPLHDEPPVSPTPNPYGPQASPSAPGAPSASAAPASGAPSTSGAPPASSAPSASGAPAAAPRSSASPATAPAAPPAASTLSSAAPKPAASASPKP